MKNSKKKMKNNLRKFFNRKKISSLIFIIKIIEIRSEINSEKSSIKDI